MTTTVEQDIESRGLTAPRVKPQDIEERIVAEHYFTAEEGVRGALAGREPDLDVSVPALGCLTFCVLTLENGFTVTGESACVSPENFDTEIGRKVARQNAINKVWPLLGYELRSLLSEDENPETARVFAVE